MTESTMKQMYITCASALGFGDLTKVKTGTERRKQLITDCADGYCEATDKGEQEKRNQYISALMLLFWGEIGKMVDKCKAVRELEYEDFASKLFECISNACNYRAWKKGKCTAEQCIRQSIASRGAPAVLYESNLDKNIANINNYSLDAESDGDENSRTTHLDLVEDPSADAKFAVQDPVSAVIQMYLDKNRVIEGIIFDLIAYTDCRRHKKEKYAASTSEGEEESGVKVTSEFWAHKLVQTISKLPEDYSNYFRSKYDVDATILQSALERIKASNNQKLYKYLEVCLKTAKTTNIASML